MEKCFVYALLLIAAWAAAWSRRLTPAASAVGVVIALLIYHVAGLTGLAMMAAFFLLGTAATWWKMNEKLSAGVAEANRGRRSTGQVLANAGVAGICALLMIITHWPPALLIAAVFSAATADTLSSELGMVYGKRFYNIISLRPDVRGRDGVVSLEGLMAGMAGSAVIAFIYATGFSFNSRFWIIVLAGTAGNLMDSVLGATAERKGWMGNDLVNFLNTFTAAGVAALLMLVV